MVFTGTFVDEDPWLSACYNTLMQFLLDWFAYGRTLRHMNELFLSQVFVLTWPVMVVWVVTCILQILI